MQAPAYSGLPLLPKADIPHSRVDPPLQGREQIRHPLFATGRNGSDA